MTKEQEVIKNIKTYIHDWVNESVDEDGYERYVIDEWDKEFMNDIETVLNMLKENSAELAEKSAEIEKKDKQIDLMANYIVDLIKYNNPEEKREVEEIKQYFESKVEE